MISYFLVRMRGNTMVATISSKGQVTIPAPLRNQLNLKTGDSVDFILSDNDVVELIPIRTSIQSLKGIVDKPAKPVTLEDMDKAIGTGGSI